MQLHCVTCNWTNSFFAPDKTIIASLLSLWGILQKYEPDVSRWLMVYFWELKYFIKIFFFCNNTGHNIVFLLHFSNISFALWNFSLTPKTWIPWEWMNNNYFCIYKWKKNERWETHMQSGVCWGEYLREWLFFFLFLCLSSQIGYLSITAGTS